MRLILLLCSLIVGCTMFAAPAYAQPGGGKTAETTPKPPAKTTTNPSTKPATTSPKVTTSPKTGTARAQAASIEGKWWTSGNDFGASEMVFTQSGSSVTGEIHYADGRTGTTQQARWSGSDCKTPGPILPARAAAAGLS